VSPNEAQLRAFLHDGEGDAPDANVLISHAQRVRRDRHRRITSIASGTAVVAVVVTGVGFLISGARDNENAGSAGGGNAAGSAASAAASNGAADKQAPVAAPHRTADGFRAEAAPSSAAQLRCPAAPLHYMLPGGGGLGAYGSSEKLFASPVGAMKLCSYPVVSSQGPVATTLTGADARHFAATLEAAPVTNGTTPRPGCASDALVGRQIEVLAVDSAGRRIKPVVITVGMCGSSKATNGTAVRYLDRVPQVARRQLFAKSPGVPPPSSPRR
jgi:hypothetical protein